MSFLPLFNIAKFKNTKDKPKIGTVINNNDPKKMGRVKIKLEGIYDPIDSQGSNLPWIRKQEDTFLNGTGTGSFSVPKVGSTVEVIWPYNNKIAVYKGITQKTNKNFTTNYPNEWGWYDDNGFVFKINRLTGTFTIKTSGSTITGDSGGNITIQGGNITITGNTTIDGKSFLSHVHSNGNNGANTGGVV